MLLSVGYSACHWCHVMAHESFEDADTAAVMNELFVNVKVDREERPDVDAIYMDAVQAMTGQGGWPMTVFLTPDGRPFFGGTYFPHGGTPRHAELRRRCAAPSTTRGATGATSLLGRPTSSTGALGRARTTRATRPRSRRAAPGARRGATSSSRQQFDDAVGRVRAAHRSSPRR